jgi:hypothetical protein
VSFRVSESLIFTAGLPLTLGSGDAITVFNATTPQDLNVLDGTAAAPDASANPLIKVQRTMQVSSAGFTGDGFENCAAILGTGLGTVTNDGQVVGVAGAAQSSSTTVASAGGADTCGIYGIGRVTGAGIGSGRGGFFNGRRETNTAGASGIEVSCDNQTVTAGTYSSTTYSATNGIWLHATGTADSGVGLAIGNPFGVQFQVGIGIPAQVVGGKTGGISTASFRDDGSAATSILINGTHATAAVAVAAAAGPVILGGTTSLTTNAALLEVQGPNSFLDPLIYIGSTANTQSYEIIVRNAVGRAIVGVCGGADSYGLVGAVAGDFVLIPATTNKSVLIGTTARVIQVKQGNLLGFFGVTPVAQSSAYTPTNVSTDRSYNANSTTIDELADVLGTVIADLQAVGLFG